jgi:hypothetical protein
MGEERIERLKRLLRGTEMLNMWLKSAHHELTPELYATNDPVYAGVIKGYLRRAKELCPNSVNIQNLPEPGDALGEVMATYQGLADFLTWEIEKSGEESQSAISSDRPAFG